LPTALAVQPKPGPGLPYYGNVTQLYQFLDHSPSDLDHLRQWYDIGEIWNMNNLEVQFSSEGYCSFCEWIV